ncbi:MAG: hypothetical protein ACYC6T_17925 [Thermoleophilia bacterium]
MGLKPENDGIVPKQACLRLDIGGEWTTRDFLALFSSLDRLYFVVYRFRTEGLPVRRGQADVGNVLGRVTRGRVAPLTVDSVNYSSPGTINLLGVGEFLEQVREFIKDMRGRNRQEREMQEAAIADARWSLEQKKHMGKVDHQLAQTRLVSEMLDLAERLQVTPGEAHRYVQRALEEPADALAELIGDGKLLGVDGISLNPLKKMAELPPGDGYESSPPEE